MKSSTNTGTPANKLNIWDEDDTPTATYLNENWQKVTSKLDVLDTANANIALTYATKADLATAQSAITTLQSNLSALDSEEQGHYNSLSSGKAAKLGQHGLAGGDYVAWATGLINPDNSEESIEYSAVKSLVSSAAVGVKAIEKKLVAVANDDTYTQFDTRYIWAYFENGIFKKWMDADEGLEAALDGNGSPISNGFWKTSSPTILANWS